MNVKNIQQAWYETNKLISNYNNSCTLEDFQIDNEASKKAGYPIYRNINNYYDYICNLGNRLEINLANSETINIWIEQPTTIEEYADCESATITIRSYHNGNSKDIVRCSTDEEKRILQSIITGALSAIKHGVDKQTTMDVAEYIGIHFFEGTKEGCCNTYDSIYTKIWRCPDNLLT